MESDESRGAAQPPPTPAGLRAGCHVHPQPLAQPRAAGGRESRCWEVAWPSPGAWLRNAGGKLEWRKRRGTFMNTHTLQIIASAPHRRRREPGEGGMGWHSSLSHAQPPSKHPSIPLSFHRPPTKAPTKALPKHSQPNSRAEPSSPGAVPAHKAMASSLHVREKGPQESNQEWIKLRLNVQNTFQIPPVALEIGTSERHASPRQRLEFFPSLSLG